jgi:hypothetical protein
MCGRSDNAGLRDGDTVHVYAAAACGYAAAARSLKYGTLQQA